MLTVSLLLWFLSVACVVVVAWPDESKRSIRERVFSDIVEPEHRPTLLTQIAQPLMPLMRLAPMAGYHRAIGGHLAAAGLSITTIEFLALQVLVLLTAFVLYAGIVGVYPFKPTWVMVCLAVSVGTPYLWLSNRIQHRRYTISRDLPEVVDLLTLCVDAGLDFMNALTKIVREFRPCPTTQELGLVLQEVRIGKRRRDALRAFSARVRTTETSSFARTLVQADRMGTGMGEALNVLSEDMRLARYHWAERFAQQAPLKMLIPLLFSLFAALLIVTGPILFQFLRGGFSAPQFSAPPPEAPPAEAAGALY